MKFLNRLVKIALKRRAEQILSFRVNPKKIQDKWFYYLIQSYKNTTFGSSLLGKKDISYKDFTNLVPIQDYENVKPWISHMMLGKSDVLWPGKTQWFSKSSGTTNDKSKFIPVSSENLKKCHLQGSHDSLAMWYFSNPQTQLLSSAKGLIMGGSLTDFEDHRETKIGDISAIMLKNMPFYGKYFHCPDISIALMSDWESKIELIAQKIIRENITNMGGVPTWTLVLLKKILEITGKKNIFEVFPDFELYMHGGVSFTPYKNQFYQFFPSEKMQYREIYNASEGYFASQFYSHETGLTPLLDNGIFYEFIPVSELESKNPLVFRIEETEADVNYAILISTNSGLMRYMPGDTVKFISTKPYLLQITGRTKHYINVFGEEVMVDNSDKALASTCEKFGVTVNEYTVGPIYLEEGKGGHEWRIEFDNAPENLFEFSQYLDNELRKINSDYDAKRYKDIALKNLKIKTVPKGSFHNWLKSKGKYGGQNKVPRLSNSRTYIENLDLYIKELES